MHGEQFPHFPFCGVFHAVFSLPISSSSLIISKFSEISYKKISVSAAFTAAETEGVLLTKLGSQQFLII
ncbi:hypothetical protein Y032_0172g371 [Ancylostoma ceylanicum]|uniref:Uncharacterized protein n=1 Tax=Ancylostoma ceylanicum TaxID=53326 RepID=A0A016SVH0_9BILA|nr:hypothetical protein Y032_0172g371 [Ancylostoma ceylanicum]